MSIENSNLINQGSKDAKLAEAAHQQEQQDKLRKARGLKDQASATRSFGPDHACAGWKNKIA